MKKGYVNWTLVLVLVLGLLAAAATVIGVRRFNRTHRAEMGIERGLAAYEQKQWKDATIYLGYYLSVHQSDVEVLVKYGDAHSRIQPLRSENYAAAVNSYRAALRYDPNQRQAVLALSQLYLEGQIPAEAELTAARYLEQQYDGPIARLLAASQMMQRKYEPAAELLQEMISKEPNEPAAYELMSRLSEQKPELTQRTPQDWMDAAVENAPENPRAYVARGSYFLRSGQPGPAREDLRKAASLAADDDVRLAIATAFLRLGDNDAAQEQLDTVFAQSPDLPLLWQLRATLAARRNDPDLALQTAKEGMAQLGDQNYVFLPFAVEMFLMGDDTASARAVLDRLRKAELNAGMASYLEGLLAEKNGDWSAAMTHWRQALTQGYTEEAVYLKLAEGSVRLEDRASAVETLRRYISRMPQSFAAQMAMAQILAESQRWSEALEYAAAAMRLEPTRADAQQLQLRCRVELAAAEPQSQARVEQMLAELIAAEDTAQNRLAAFQIVLRRKDWDTAERMLGDITQKFGDTVSVRTARAELLARKGQLEPAFEMLDAAMAQFPDASEPVMMKASLLAQHNNVAAAVSLLAEASPRFEGQPQRRMRLWTAELLYRSGRTEEAMALLTEMAGQNPQDIAVRRQLLSIGRTTIDLSQRQQWIDEIKAIEGETGRLWKIEQASLWLLEDDFVRHYVEAAALLNENLSVNPDDKQSLMLLAAAHERAGNLQLSVSLYRESLMRHPEDIDLAIATMGAMYRAEEFRQADQLLNDLLAAGHTDPRLAQLELQSHLRQGRMDNAEGMLEKMVAENAHDSGAKLSLAMLKSRSGQFEQARVLIDALIAENPKSLAVRAALADWHLRQVQTEQAIGACNDYLSAFDEPDGYRLRAQVLLVVGQKEQAIADIEQLSAMAGSNTELLLSVSELYRIAGRSEKALDAARRALAAEPGSFQAQKQAALLLLDNPQTQSEGTGLLASALAMEPRDAQLRLRKGRLLLESDSSTAAIEGLSLLNALVSEYPRLEPAWDLLGQWYLFNNQPAMAMDTALRGLSSLPDSRLLLILKARVEAMRSPAIALETLAPLMRRYPQDAGIVEMHARLLSQTGQTEQAAGALQAWVNTAGAMSVDTQPVELTLMELLYQSGQTDSAAALYQTLQSRPDQAMPAMLRWIGLIVKTDSAEQLTAVFDTWYAAYPDQGGTAALSAAQGLMNEQSATATTAAEQILQKVIAQNPNSTEAVFGLALLRHVNGRQQEAIPLYERVIQLQDDNVLALNNLAWLLSQERGDHARARELAVKGLAIAPAYTDLIDTYAAILYAAGDYEMAAEQAKRAINLYRDSQPEKTVSVFRLAQCLEKQGKKDAAQVEYFRAQDLDQKNGGLSAQQKADLLQAIQ